MVEFKIKVNREQRLAYIPKEIFEALGTELTAVPNRAAVLLYPKHMPIEDVVKSLTLIKEDLEHGVALEKKAER